MSASLLLVKKTLSFCLLLAVLIPCFGLAQERPGPLSLEEIEGVLRDLDPKRAADIIRQRGVNFEITPDVTERLRRSGLDAVVIQAVERAGMEYVKRKLEEDKKRVEEERKKVEEEKKKIEEARQRQEQQKRQEEARRRAEEEKKRSGDDAEMVFVPAGEFWMGSEDGDADEKPRRRVYLDAFQIDKYEVTNVLYRKFMEATGRPAPSYWNDGRFNGSNQPVVGVSWDDAEAYRRWAGKRLPTEAEWEKAARGTDGRKYPWGDQWDSSRANGENKLGKTAPVGSYPNGASPYGVHDMAGNVWEWVADWYEANYYQRAPNRNPKGPDTGQSRVLRGGSWFYGPATLRSADRHRFDPSQGRPLTHLGFRCAQ